MTKQNVLDAIKDFSEEFPKEALMETRTNAEQIIDAVAYSSI